MESQITLSDIVRLLSSAITNDLSYDWDDVAWIRIEVDDGAVEKLSTGDGFVITVIAAASSTTLPVEIHWRIIILFEFLRYAATSCNSSAAVKRFVGYLLMWF